MLDLGKYGGIAEMMADVDDLEKLGHALAREMSIRAVMAETGEDRETVLSVMEAGESMDQEAVLDLMEGAPTTLREGLSEYLTVLQGADELQPRDRILSDLGALLHYPWPEEEAVVTLHKDNHSLDLEAALDNRDLKVRIGGQTVYTVDWEDAGSAGVRAAEEVAGIVHRAVLARVIADRPHHVQLSSTDRRSLLAWLEQPNGSWSTDEPSRFTVNAVEGGGILVRTRPYWAAQQIRSRPIG